MGKPDAPSPPDPLRTASAATGTNVSTAVANAYLNNTNQVTPDGNLNYNATGSYGWTDPTTGSTYNIPTFTATQTLSEQGQAIKGQTDAAKYNLAGMANAQSGRISGLLSSNMDPTFNAQGYLAANPDVANYAREHGIDPTQFAAQHYAVNGIGEGRTGGAVPGGGNASSITGIPQAQTSFDPGNPVQTSFGGNGGITNSYGTDFSADRQRVEDSLMARMNPQLAIEKKGVEQQLADQGIRYGSQAYADAMDNYSRQANDARFGAIGQAGAEQQRMVQEEAQRAAFQNTAQQQGYEQALGRGSFANQAQGQQFQQNAAQGTFANAGLAQQVAQSQAGFNAQQAARNSYMQEQYAQRNQPINEISALMSGGQVSQPNFVNTPGSQIPTTDVAGLINNQFSQQMGVYQQQNQNYQQLMGGILGLGAGALKGYQSSDRREKDDIDRIATVFAASDEGEAKKLPIYSYAYKDDPASTRHIGPMAQDVEKINPSHVVNAGGRKFIKPQQVMGSILRAA